MLLEWLVARRTAQVLGAQEAYIEQLLSNPQFASEEAARPHHAELSAWIEPGRCRRVLELGCGPGRYVAMMASLGLRVVGADPLRFPLWDRIAAASNAELRDGIRAEELPYPDESFDAVCCLGALLYFEEPDRALSEMRRVLSPGGRLLLRTVNAGNLYTSFTAKKLDPASRNLYKKSELLDLVAESGFAIARYFSFGFFPPILSNWYWYLQNVHLSASQQQWLSDRLREEHRVNHVVFAQRPDRSSSRL